MPNLTLTTPTLTNPANKSEIEGNFSDVTTLLNGGLDNDNIIASAGIATSKLVARDYEFLVDLRVQPTTAVQPPTSAVIPICVVGLPGDASDGVSYTILSGNYYLIDDGTAGNTTFEIQYGYANAGNWVQVGSDLVATVTLASGGANTEQSGSLTINTATMTTDNTRRYFVGLFLTGLGANALNTAYSALFATLKVRRTDGMRGT